MSGPQKPVVDYWANYRPSRPHPFYYGWWGRRIGRAIDRAIRWWTNHE